MSENNYPKYIKFLGKVLLKLRPRFSFHYVAYTTLFFLVIFSVIQLVSATTPNPGHPWSQLGDGVFVFTNGETNPLNYKTYTFPNANAVVLTTNDAVTLAQGGTGSSLSDPNANKLLGWDDTDNDTRFITLGANLSYDAGTDTLSASGASTWNAITNPTGTQSLTFDDAELNAWTVSSDTETFHTYTANSLTTGKILSLASSSLTSGTLLDLSSNGTGALTNQKGLNISLAGTNGTGAQTTYGAYLSNTHAGSGTNVGLYSTASGGTNNYAAIFPDGNVGIGPTSPDAHLHVSKTTSGEGDSNFIKVSETSYNRDIKMGLMLSAANAFPGIWLNAASPDFTNYAFLGDSATGNIFNAPSGLDIMFRIANSAKMTLKGSGNLGIGVTGPTAVLHLKAGTATASTAPLKFNAGTNTTDPEPGAMEWDGTNLFMTQNGSVRKTIAYTTDITPTAWNSIAAPTGTQSLTFDDAELNAWTVSSDTETFHTYTANSLTTGKILSLASSSLTSGTLLDLSSNGTGALTNQKGLNISLAGTNGTGGQTTYGAYISNTHAGTTSTNVGLYATATGGTTANYAALLGGDLYFDATNNDNLYRLITTVAASSPGLLKIKGGNSNIATGSLYLEGGNATSGPDVGGGSLYLNGGVGIGAANGDIIIANSYGKLSVGSTTATSLFNVGSAAQFQVNSSGAIAAATGYTQGSGTMSLTSANTTQTTTGSAFAGNFNSLTTGTGMYLASSSLTSGSLLDLSSNGTGALTNQKGLNISLAGTNGTGAQTTYGAYLSNTHAGTTSTNVGLYATASGGTTANYAAIFDAGNVGIGTTSPTARLHLAAGTTGAGTAPLKFTSGTNMTAAEAGAMEWDGTNLFITQTSGPTRKTIAYTDGTVTNATNAVNIGITDDTTTNATMYPTWVTANTGNLPAKVSSTKLSFNPSTGTVSTTGIDLGTTTLLGSRALTVDTGGVFDINLGSASGDDFTVDTSSLVVEGDTGNVGIRDTTPDASLDIDSSITSGADFGITNTGVYTGTGLFNVTANSATTGVLGLLTGNGLSSGSILSLASNGTAALTGQKGLNISLAGTNGSASQTTYGAYLSNTHAGSGTNVGLYTTASGGTNNLGLNVDAGQSLFGGTTLTSGTLAKLNIVSTMASNGSTTAIAGIHGDYTFNNGGSANYVQVGNRFVFNNAPTTNSNTMAGEIIRVNDDTSLANLVRGIDVNTIDDSSNTAGTNTGIRAKGGTFGVQGITNSASGGVSVPAALYGENTGTTNGDVLRLFSSSVTSAPSFATFYHNTSTFTGTGLLMDFATGSGTFSGNFIDLRKNSTPLFTVTNAGIVSMGLSGTASTTAVCSSLANTTAPTAGVAYEIRDCSGAPAADYAEMYPVENEIDYGDIVAVGDEMINTYDTTNGEIDWNKVKGKVTKLIKSDNPYQRNVVGIVSDNNGDFSSTGYNIKKEDRPMPVALSGRVPVKISNNSETIEAGDYITTSDEAGKAMKAVKSGQVIGKALESWSPSSGKETVMLFIEQGYQNTESLADSFNIDVDSVNEDGILVSQKILEGLINNDVSTDDYLSEVLTDRLIAGLEIITPNIFTNNLTAEGEVSFNGLTFFNESVDFAEAVKFKNQTLFEVPPLFNSDTAGFAIIKEGSKEVRVSFDNPYLTTPVVTTSITFEKDNDSNFGEEEFFNQDIKSVVKDKDQTGFTIVLNKKASQDINFSWIALAVKDAEVFESVIDGLIIEDTIEDTTENIVEDIVIEEETITEDKTIKEDVVEDTTDTTAEVTTEEEVKNEDTISQEETIIEENKTEDVVTEGEPFSEGTTKDTPTQ